MASVSDDPPRLGARLNDAARRLLSLLRETDEVELKPAASESDLPYSVLCIAVGCLAQARVVSLHEARGTIFVRLRRKAPPTEP